MVNASLRKYETYDKFITDFILNVIENGNAVIIVNYQDYQGMIASLNGKVVNGESLVLDIESADLFDSDIEYAKEHDGNIMITVFKNGLIIGEPIQFPKKAVSFFNTNYFIEADAAETAMDYAIDSTCIPFQIENKIKL